jgi:uncharacterized protein with von Willebrand factor type A (vWA) domain
MTPEEIKALIAEAIKEASGSFAQLANDAATAHTKRMAKDLEAKLAEFKPAAPTAAPSVDPAVAEKIKTTPEMAALQAQIADMKTAYEKAESARLAAEKKSRDDSAFHTLRSSLSAVRPELQDAAAQLLFHVEKRVTFDEAGRPLFKMPREVAGVIEDIEMPLANGVEHWMKNEAAKAFLPAPGGNVGNGRGGKAPSPGSIPSSRMNNGMPVYDKPAITDAEKIARADERAAALQKIIGDNF